MLSVDFERAENRSDCDVAIIGAGVSGLYCAWRLLDSDKDLKITIIERLDRTGGRLDSDIVEIAPGEKVREEEGGMRFNYGMTELMTLNNALGLCDQIVPFPMGTPDQPNRFALRGRNFTLKDATDSGNMIWSELYNLKPEEIGLSPTELVTVAYRNILYANGKPYVPGQTPEEWAEFRETCTWNGRTMNDWQLWGLLRDMAYSQDCIQMLSETIGFAGPFKSLANAGDAFQILADFPVDPQYFTFRCGFSTLPDALVARMERDHGDRVNIVLSANVDAIGREGDRFSLTITKAVRPVNARPVMPGGKEKVLTADKLVVAAAAKGCEDLFNRSPALRDGPEAVKLWDAIHSALGMKLMKINLYFAKPWWQDGMTGRDKVQFGPNFSDMPVNAVYPFYALPDESDADGLPPIPDAAAALTVYCDFDNTNFWHGLQNLTPMFTSDLQTRENEKVPQVLFGASEAVVDEALRQLATLFGTNSVPRPVLTSYRLWDGAEDFEFAYHQWRMNVQDSAVRDYLSNPSENLFFCNEAFSDMHGWVNGSLRSTNKALEQLGKALIGSPIPPLDGEPCIDPKTGSPQVDQPIWRLGPWGA